MKPETVIIRGQLIPKDGEEARQTSPVGGQRDVCVADFKKKKRKKHNKNPKLNKRTSKK